MITMVMIMMMATMKKTTILCEACEVDEAALYYCKYDNECKTSFFLDQVSLSSTPLSEFDNTDVDEYEKNIFYHHHRLLLERSGSETKYIIENGSICNNTNIQKLWLVIMRMSQFCNTNEIYELGVGCVCSRGKQCDEEDGNSYYGSPYLFVIISIATIAVVICSISSIRVVIPLEKIVHLIIQNKIQS